MPLVRVNGELIKDWESFHAVFAEAFGFPDFYGRNMNAWIDCMTSLDAPADGMTSVHGSVSDPVVLQLDNANALPTELFEAVTECSAFVNWRRIEVGEPAILILSCYRTQST
jgi:hypothetical protein